MFNLIKTPYLLDRIASEQVKGRLNSLEERVALLRKTGTLNEQTIRDFYGEKRFEQVAESNAIEGGTLSAGETEIAVLKGITITGHDPAFARDAVALDQALQRITILAKDKSVPTNLNQLHQIHALLLGDRPGAGVFRNQRVNIRGAEHTPPKTLEDVMKQMTHWQTWSENNTNLPAPIRATVLHAWLAHIHPFIDGNGRTCRAVSNLELIRAGYPPIIIKKKERERYIDALAESDQAGDIRSFMELIFDKIDGSLTGLELSARKRQGYNPAIEKIRNRQKNQLDIWETSVRLLASIIQNNLSQALESVGGHCAIHVFEEPLDLDDYIEICNGRNVPRTWAFTVRLEVPGITRLEKLAYIGHRSSRMYQHLDHVGGPSLFWSRKNPEGFSKWISDGSNSPFATEITSLAGNGDEWYALLADDSIYRIQTTEVSTKIADALMNQVTAEC